MPRHKYMSECERRAQEVAERASERKLDALRFRWFFIGVAFAVVMIAVVELALKRAGI